MINYLNEELVNPKKLTYRLELSDKKKRLKKIVNLKMLLIICWISSALWLTLLGQGIYLIQSGYSVEFGDVDPALLGKTATRTRGKGALLLPLIKYFPYFLIAGSIIAILQSIAEAWLHIPKEIKRLEEFDIDIQSASDEEKKVLLEKVLNKASQLQKVELQRIERLEIKEKRKKEALDGNPVWLDDKQQEGWLLNPETSRIKRFYKEPEETNNRGFIKEETGEVKDRESPLITKHCY